jgi:hypothetical protein
MMASRPSCPLTEPSQSELDWLLKAGVEIKALIDPEPMRVAAGLRAADGLFEPDADSPRWLAFDEVTTDDIVFWQPRLGMMACWTGRTFALGQDIIDNAATYSFDCALNIFADPLEWLRARRDGIVVLDWSRAFDRLRDTPRIAIAESLLHTYQRVMKPPRMPELFVIPDRRRAAA